MHSFQFPGADRPARMGSGDQDGKGGRRGEEELARGAADPGQGARGQGRRGGGEGLLPESLPLAPGRHRTPRGGPPLVSRTVHP